MRILLLLIAAACAACSAPGAELELLREAPPEIYAMSFNVRTAAADDGPDRWENRKELAAQVIRSQSPHVIAIQEALPAQMDWLLEQFPSYVAVGEHREGGRVGEFSGLLVDDSRLRIDRSGQMWISPEPKRVGDIAWDAALPRTITWARLADRLTGATFQAYGTHFDHRGARSRAEGARMIVEHVAATAKPVGVPVLVLGDLNAGEDSEPLAILLGAGLRDTLRVVDPEADVVGTFHGFDGTRDGEKLDYVLCSDAFEVLDAAILTEAKDGRFPSDHFPVAALVVLPTVEARSQP